MVGESEEAAGGVGGDVATDGGSGKVVVVGVKLDSRSRELLTWALVKVAQSGDRVIALHVLNSDTESKSSLLSLVKTFDSVLAAYEGFCHLKQVDLKLKVCRGSSVRKILVREVKSYGVANLVIGTSKAHHTIFPSASSLAKYCARSLSKSFSVIAVNNGKIVFQREANTTVCDLQDNDGKKHHVWLVQRSLSRKPKAIHNAIICTEASESNQLTSLGNGSENNSMALVSVKVRESTESKWPMLRGMFLRSGSGQQMEKSSLKKTSLMQWVLRLPNRQSMAVVYPDQKQSNSDGAEYHLPKLDEESGAVVLVGADAASPPHSPSYSIKILPEELDGLHEKYSSTCRLFNYQELMLATSNFIPEQMVGKGGSSKVYRGCLPDGRDLAVKILKPLKDVLKQFVSEIDIITNLHHQNVISLFGFCFEDNNLLLVYDFLSRGSLEENLHGCSKKRIAFGWENRYKVALGVAEALDYIHNGLTEPIIHRDVKSSNILLSDDFEPQLSDFGLAMRASCSSHHITCNDVVGTFGYLAPECFLHGKVNDKVDVYAFGIVLLELLSGRKPIDTEYPKGQQSLVMWARPILEGGKVSQLLDPCLTGDYDNDHIERMVLAATLCIRHAPQNRPQIGLILKLLQGDDEVIKWAKQQITDSEEFDGGDVEAFPANIQSHLNLALQDIEDDLSISSTEQTVSVEEYLRGRCSRSSSFD